MIDYSKLAFPKPWKKEKKHKGIKQISTKNKNTIAKFSSKVKAEILIRDRQCIFCQSPITDIHHAYFWNESNRTETRNDVNQWVWVCRIHHDEIHWCAIWEWKRQEAINYLKNKYEREINWNSNS
jgi:hypothetical protein